MPTVSRSLRNIIASALILFALGLSNTSYAGDTITFCGKAHAPDVTKVQCSDPSVSDLSPLKGLNSLQDLDLRRTQVSDLSPLKGLNSLQTLNLRYTKVSDLSPLKGLNNLQVLYLSYTQVKDLSAIQHLIDDGLKVKGP